MFENGLVNSFQNVWKRGWLTVVEVIVGMRTPVAQSVEHRAVTREVVSSTSAGPTLTVLK